MKLCNISGMLDSNDKYLFSKDGKPEVMVKDDVHVFGPNPVHLLRECLDDGDSEEDSVDVFGTHTPRIKHRRHQSKLVEIGDIPVSLSQLYKDWFENKSLPCCVIDDRSSPLMVYSDDVEEMLSMLRLTYC